MKYLPLVAAGLMLGATVAVAQQPADIPPVKCEPPNVPGSRMMEDTSIRKRFERDMKAYGDCMRTYVNERQAAAKSLQEQARAHAEAGNAAVGQYNAAVKAANEAAKQ